MRLNSLSKMAAILTLSALCASAWGAANPYLGSWELTLPGGGPGWLGVKEKNGKLQASIMWVAGSVVPVDSAKAEKGKLVLIRNHTSEKKENGKTVKKTVTETITGTAEGDKISFVSVRPRDDGKGENRSTFTGRRSPPMPAAPDLSKVKFGEPVSLFNGNDLTGWTLTDPNAINGWMAKDGLLVNTAKQEEGKPHKNFGNLRTTAEFGDFNLKLEAKVQKGGNSGIYLRGIYEIQVADSYGLAPESHGIGSVYSRITPSANPAKPPGEWQSFDIILVQRHVTVVLNGVKIIDNQAVEGCTGGALWADVMRPGPIYLQGDHTAVEYRNISLRPVVK